MGGLAKIGHAPNCLAQKYHTGNPYRSRGYHPQRIHAGRQLAQVDGSLYRQIAHRAMLAYKLHRRYAINRAKMQQTGGWVGGNAERLRRAALAALLQPKAGEGAGGL